MKKIVLALILSLSLVSTSFAAELIMFSTKTCGYCRAFLKEVAPTYAQSEYAKLLPLRIISMDEAHAPKWFDRAYDEQRIDPIVGTPTFVVFNNGHEVARLMGYLSKEDFYKDIGGFYTKNLERLRATAGQNPIPHEPGMEIDPNAPSVEGSHTKGGSVPEQQHPTVPFMMPNMGAKEKNDEPKTRKSHPHEPKKIEKFPNGVYKSQDIMDHIYDTETEAQTAANFLGCMGTHTHFIKGKKIWMPCQMN